MGYQFLYRGIDEQQFRKGNRRFPTVETDVNLDRSLVENTLDQDELTSPSFDFYPFALGVVFIQ